MQFSKGVVYSLRRAEQSGRRHAPHGKVSWCIAVRDFRIFPKSAA
jgi:hypothetical protein